MLGDVVARGEPHAGRPGDVAQRLVACTAGRALLRRGEPAASIPLLIQAEAWDDAASAVVAALSAAHPPVSRDMLADWYARLPPEVADAPAGQLLAAVMSNETDPAGARTRLEEAAAAFRARDDAAGELTCLVHLIPVISAYHGAQAVDERVVWSARALGARRLGTWGGVVLPASLPQLLPGLRLAIGISIFTLLGSELLIRGEGVGAFLFTALDNGQTLTVFATSSVIACLGFLLDAAFVLAVRRGLRWIEVDW